MKRKRSNKPVPPREKRIVQSADERAIGHREDFRHCPECDHPMDGDAWDKAAVTLVLQPAYYKAGYVSIISECPQCFELSWVHHRMSSFQFDDSWPKSWQEAVKKQEAAVKLEALREWERGICHKCRHLASATVEYHCSRVCIVGMGRPETKCYKFEEVK